MTNTKATQARIKLSVIRIVYLLRYFEVESLRAIVPLETCDGLLNSMGLCF